MQFNLFQKIILTVLIGELIYWFVLHFLGQQTSTWNLTYSLSYGFIPFLGGLFAFFVAKPWGGFKSAVGRTILFIGIGSFMWGVGSLTWSYYNFVLHINVPYPSLSDVGFIMAIPFWLIGMINLSKATGAKFALKRTNGKIFLFLLPFAIISFSYYLLVSVARAGVLSSSLNNSLKLFFDLAYPVGDVIILTFSLLIFGLSFRYFGGKYKKDIFIILLGYGFMYFADFLFSYRTTLNIYFNGDYSDLLFTIALSFMILGIYGFSLKKSKDV